MVCYPVLLSGREEKLSERIGDKLDRSTQESMNVEVQSSAGAIIQHISECQPVVMECIEQTMKTPMTNLYELVYR